MFQRAFCAYCHDRIWGLGRQGFKCTQCKLLVHKKCHKLIKVGCDSKNVRELEQQFESAHGRINSGSGSIGGVPSQRHGNGASAADHSMGKWKKEGGGYFSPAKFYAKIIPKWNDAQ